MRKKTIMQPSGYTSKSAYPACALAQWNFHVTDRSTSRVLPDGCRDIILQKIPGAEQTWFVSELSASAYAVFSSAGSRLQGLRLRPGVQIDHARLSSWLSANEPQDIFLSDQLDEFCFRSTRIEEILDCIESDAMTVQGVAK